jgi:hypothetical protein
MGVGRPLIIHSTAFGCGWDKLNALFPIALENSTVVVHPLERASKRAANVAVNIQVDRSTDGSR